MNVLFVIVDISFADHIAIAYLSAMAKSVSWKTDICVLSEHDVMEKMKLNKPEVVAYSANVEGFNTLVELNNRLKKDFSFISILGGPQATFSPETFSNSGMDAYCVGEGDYAFRDFLVNVLNNKSFDDIENIITKKKANPIRNLIEDLDELPMPDRDLTLSSTFIKNTPKKTFYATRGCPYNCTYCCNNYYQKLYRGKGTIVRRFSVERLISEIESVKYKYRMDFVKFGDDVFVTKANQWLEEFSVQYKKRINIPFNCYLRLDIIEEDVLRLLKEAGCHSVHLSVDSTSKIVRDKVLKRKMLNTITNEDLINKLKLIDKYNLKTWVNFMLAAPESTLKDEIESIYFCKEGNVTYPSFTVTHPMIGTELYEYAEKNDLIDKESFNHHLASMYQKSQLKCFTEKEKNITYNIYLLGALIVKFPKMFIPLLIKLISIIPPNKLFVWIRHKFYIYYIENIIFKLNK